MWLAIDWLVARASRRATSPAHTQAVLAAARTMPGSSEQQQHLVFNLLAPPPSMHPHHALVVASAALASAEASARLPKHPALAVEPQLGAAALEAPPPAAGPAPDVKALAAAFQEAKLAARTASGSDGAHPPCVRAIAAAFEAASYTAAADKLAHSSPLHSSSHAAGSAAAAKQPRALVVASTQHQDHLDDAWLRWMSRTLHMGCVTAGATAGLVTALHLMAPQAFVGHVSAMECRSLL